ncbi:hypothetical protein RhiJN_06033 [Ceratobasidium sp. AG-Ba]|nr:hypothetical protein RhiJN_06033 [Ceratobasidium sp. AG-Ba]
MAPLRGTNTCSLDFQYIINRGARRTLRLSSPQAVVLVIFYLRSLSELAKSIHEQIVALMCAFEMNVVAVRCLLHQGLTLKEETELLKQLGPGISYHLALLFVTESSPGGGWWHTSEHGNQHKSQISESSFLEQCRYYVRHISKDAVTCRIFGTACGMNLQGPTTIQDICSCLIPTRFLSLVLPTATNLMMSDYSHILPEIFLNIYYFGSPLRSSCNRVWGRSVDARYHTGLLFIDRATPQEQFLVTKILHAPPQHRPYGLTLPDCSSICGCTSGQPKWTYKTEKQHRKEFIYIYISSCRHVDLRVAVYPSRRRIVERFGTQFVEEDWDKEKRQFHFDEPTMVRMLVQPGHTAAPLTLKESDKPWTIAGRRAAKQPESQTTQVDSTRAR